MKGAFISNYIFLFLICLFMACGNSTSQTAKPSPTTQQSDKTELTVSMKRNACFMGKCPVYELTIQPDGKVVFEGLENTKIKGTVEDRLSEEKIEQLTAEIRKVNIFGLKNSYTEDSGNCPKILHDSSSVMLSIKLDKKEKRIEHYQGCFELRQGSSEPFPEQLFKLELKIDEIANTGRWTGEAK